MLASSVLEVAIGLTFVFLLMSLICSAANELVESVFKNRATDLERGLRELFNQEGGKGLVEQLYNHPMIDGLFTGKYKRGDRPIRRRNYFWPTNLPNYIPSQNFAQAITDIVLHPPTTQEKRDNANAVNTNASVSNSRSLPTALPVSMGAFRLALKHNIPDSQIARALRTAAEQAGDDVEALRQNIETWFNNAMDRVSGRYKRRTQWIIFGVGFIFTVLLNVNTITIATTLSTDATLRSVVVAQAEGFASRPDAQKPDLEKNKADLHDLGLPLGWQQGIDFINPLKNAKFNVWDHALLPLLGWLLTAIAISLGAPFWFDLLSKFIVIRSTIKPAEKSREEVATDRLTNEIRAVTGTAAITTTTSSSGPDNTLASGFGFISQPEPIFRGDPDPIDNDTHLDESDAPSPDLTADDELPPTEGGVG